MNLITIQDSFEEVISDVKNGILEQDKFWIAKRNIESDENQDFWYINVQALQMKDDANSVDVQYMKANEYKIRTDGNTYNLKSFYRKINIAKDKISSVAIASNNQHLVIGTKGGDLIIYNMMTDSVEKKINGAHFEDITTVKFFPSNKVILSVGIDLKIKLWGLNGELVRTMINQVKAITSISLLGKTGRNFVSGSKDGSIDVWECGTGQVIYSFNRIQDKNDPVNTLVIGEHESEGTKLSELEFETSNQCVYVGYESGIVQQFDIGDHCQTRVRFQDGSSAVTSMDKIDESLICGYSDGKLNIWNTASGELIFKHQLNSHYPISQVFALERQNNIMSVLVYNGPEILLKLDIDIEKNVLETTYLVGMEENFKVSDIASSKDNIVIGADEVFLYRR